VRLVVRPFRSRYPVRERNTQFKAAKRFGIVSCLDAAEFEYQSSVVQPNPFNINGLCHFTRRNQKCVPNPVEPLRTASQRIGRHLTPNTARPLNDGERNPPRFRLQTLLQDIESKAPVQLHSSRAEQRANRSRRPALLTDDFAEIAWGDPKFEKSCLLPRYFTHTHFFR